MIERIRSDAERTPGVDRATWASVPEEIRAVYGIAESVTGLAARGSVPAQALIAKANKICGAYNPGLVLRNGG